LKTILSFSSAAQKESVLLRILGTSRFVLIVVASLIVQGSGMSSVTGPKRPVQNRRQKTATKPAVPKKPRIDYSQFSHITHVTTQKLACDSCHKFPTRNWKEVRTAEAAFPDVAEFPEHSSCLNCHRPQFFARERPAPAICSNCHVNASPRDTARFLFPSLRDVSDSKLKTRKFSSEFGVFFPHDKHADVIGRNGQMPRPGVRFIPVRFGLAGSSGSQESDPKNCSFCHQTYQPQGKSDEEFVTKPPKGLSDDAFWLKKGTFKTKPSSHAGCFTCHSQESDVPPKSSECAMCHQTPSVGSQGPQDFDPGLAVTMGIIDPVTLGAWVKREAGRFQHDFSSHAELSCTTCHSIAAMNTVDERTLKVPVKSCGGGGDGCHITATADDGGILNFAVNERQRDPTFRCTKCHINLGKEPVPKSHLDAIEAFKKK
jgi:Cytochrome c7 and related cytochrome c